MLARVDVEGAVALVRIARSFDWSWTDEGIERFARIAGWRPNGDGIYKSKIDIEDPVAQVSRHEGLLEDWGGAHESILEINIRVAEGVNPRDPAAMPLLSQMFSAINDRMMEEFDPPNSVGFEGGQWRTSFWKQENLVVKLGFIPAVLLLEFVNPHYENFRQYTDDLDNEHQ